MRISQADYLQMCQRVAKHEPITRHDPEAEIHDEIVKICREHSWYFVHSRMDKRTTCGIGTPDFFIFMPGGHVVAIECKSGNAKLRPEQQAVFAWLTKLGFGCTIIRSVEKARMVLNSFDLSV